jgi:hypothetical protein
LNQKPIFDFDGKMIIHNGRKYYDSELIEWETVIEAGSYFERARFLNLPQPPACLVYCPENIEDITSEQCLIMADYQQRYDAAEKTEREKSPQ